MTTTPTTPIPSANPIRTEERAYAAMCAWAARCPEDRRRFVFVGTWLATDKYSDTIGRGIAVSKTIEGLADAVVPAWDAPPERPLPVPMTKEEIAAAVELPRSVATHAIWPTGTVFIGSMYCHEDKPPRGAVFFDASTTTPEQAYRYALAHTDDNGRFVPPKGE